MTDEPHNRINMEKGRQVYEATLARLASNPESGKTTIRAVATLLEDMHLEGRVGRFRLESDEPAVRGSGLDADLADPLERCAARPERRPYRRRRSRTPRTAMIATSWCSVFLSRMTRRR